MSYATERSFAEATGTRDVAKIAARLSEPQRRALLAFDKPEVAWTENFATAAELGVSGRTLMSMWGLGGVDDATLELGPILCTRDYWFTEARWSRTPLGEKVSAHLLRETR